MDEIKLEQLEEMQKELFRRQCDLDIQKAIVKHFIKEKQSEQLNLTDVVDEFYCDIVVGEEGYRCKEQCQICKDYIDKQQ